MSRPAARCIGRSSGGRPYISSAVTRKTLALRPLFVLAERAQARADSLKLHAVRALA